MAFVGAKGLFELAPRADLEEIKVLKAKKFQRLASEGHLKPCKLWNFLINNCNLLFLLASRHHKSV